MQKNAPFMTMKALQVIQCLNTKAFNARMKWHVFLRSTARSQAIYYLTLADSIDGAQKAIEDNYCGCYASLADYAEELTEETTQIPEHLAFYIDY